MKKTAVRVQEFKSDVDGIGLGTIQILDKEYKESSLEPIGHIQFQRTLSEGDDSEWYGLTYKVDTTNISHLRKMNKIADKIVAHCSLINKSSWEMQLSDVLDALSAEKYGLFKHEFYPLEMEGKNLYDIKFLGSVYTRIAAEDEEAAKKEMKQRGFNKHELEFISIIKF